MRHFTTMLRPLRRFRGTGARRVMIAVVAVVVVVSLIPSIPFFPPSGEEAPTICACGCGNPEGECCCAASKGTGLAMSCSQRDDPNDPVETTNGCKIIGPPGVIELIGPSLADADLSNLEFGFAGLDPRPEIPPPRA